MCTHLRDFEEANHLQYQASMHRFTFCAVLLTACAADAPDHDEPSDYDLVSWTPDGKADYSGVPAVFDKNQVISDAVFTTPAVDADAIQQFLEHSPYGNRSWLADYQVGGVPFSQRVVEIAEAHGIDPAMLVVRLQVESSVVSKTATPSTSTLNHAAGCGCPDGGGCSSTYRGFEAQLDCAAATYEKWFDASEAGTGQWRVGHTTKSLDGVSVTPRDNATASLYQYTPWVLPNRGGAWLTWNVTRRYLKAFDQAGTLHLP